MPEFTDYAMKNRTYRYYTGKPLYPFGYGLTYGDVAVTDVSASTGSAVVTVENKGSRATDDVIQLYIKDLESPDAPVNPILCGFQRVTLAAGEKKQLEIAIDPAALTVVNDAGQRIPGSGKWMLYAGNGQPDARTAELTGKQAVCVELK
jgi:beta-glucosidase